MSSQTSQQSHQGGEITKKEKKGAKLKDRKEVEPKFTDRLMRQKTKSKIASDILSSRRLQMQGSHNRSNFSKIFPESPNSGQAHPNELNSHSNYQRNE